MKTTATQHWRGWLALAAAGAVGPFAGADLAPTSPFLPTGAAATGAGAATPAGPIELRGIMQGPEGASYCIYDTAKKKDFWVGLNESGHDYVVKAADANADSVTVAYQGRTLKLSLHTAKVTSAGSGGAGPVGAMYGSATIVTPAPADEQRRLDAVAQEVRRRRAERERAAGEAPNTVPGAGQPPPGAARPPPPAAR